MSKLKRALPRLALAVLPWLALAVLVLVCLRALERAGEADHLAAQLLAARDSTRLLRTYVAENEELRQVNARLAVPGRDSLAAQLSGEVERLTRRLKARPVQVIRLEHDAPPDTVYETVFQVISWPDSLSFTVADTVGAVAVAGTFTATHPPHWQVRYRLWADILPQTFTTYVVERDVEGVPVTEVWVDTPAGSQRIDAYTRSAPRRPPRWTISAGAGVLLAPSPALGLDVQASRRLLGRLSLTGGALLTGEGAAARAALTVRL